VKSRAAEICPGPLRELLQFKLRFGSPKMCRISPTEMDRFGWCRTILCSVGALPFVRALTDGVLPGVCAWLDALFAKQCHRLAARMLPGLAFPVCARCLGIYAGIGLAGALSARGTVRFNASAFALALLATLVELAGEARGTWSSHGAFRLLSGAALGWTSAALLLHGLRRSAEHGATRGAQGRAS
jgi:uncharacterized membrane protein